MPFIHLEIFGEEFVKENLVYGFLKTLLYSKNNKNKENIGYIWVFCHKKTKIQIRIILNVFKNY